jgi:hypoxanthine-guanine phosphoribosyltransferase
MYALEDLITVAKRENNTKRKYLYVNPVQGKHIPVSPSASMRLFADLTEKIEERYQDEKLLLIGFAETATAIGASIAYGSDNVAYYMNTSREEISGAEYLFFTEAHSHATEQRLAVNGFDGILDQIDRIVFAEDEVTTGNTIENIIRLLRKRYPDRSLNFGIVSVLNSMSDERLAEFERQNIFCDFLYRIPFQFRIDSVEHHSYLKPQQDPIYETHTPVDTMKKSGYWNSRLLADVADIRARTDQFAKSVLSNQKNIENAGSILILGTEEFMFPGMMIGCEIEKRWPDKTVRFHATTRSPIEVSQDPDYMLHSRHPLASMYDNDRRTFIYNLERYDLVLIVTDAEVCRDGLDSLVAALEMHGNSNITLIQWGSFSNA